MSGGPADLERVTGQANVQEGRVVLAAADSHAGQRFTVLCGHTHSAAEARIAPNVLVLAGDADYGNPRLQPMLELP